MKKIKQILIWCLNKAKAFFPWYRSLYRGRAWYTKTAIGIVSCIAAFLIYLGMVDMNFLWLFGKSPGFYTIMNPETHEASEIYSEDGVLIGKFFNENRTPVKYEEVNPAFGMLLSIQRMNDSTTIWVLTIGDYSVQPKMPSFITTHEARLLLHSS